MSATISGKHPLARGGAAFFDRVQSSVAMVVLVIVFIIVGVFANRLGVFGVAGPSTGFPVLDREPAAQSDAERTTQTLTPAMRAALDNVSQRYRVSAEALRPVFEAAQSVAPMRQLDPLLIIAVIGIESRFNPFSQSPMGAQGLMQIIPRYHKDKVPDTAPQHPFLDPVTNVNMGASILQEAIRRQGGLLEGLQYYGGVLDDEDKTYANKVLSEKLRLEQASRRRESPGR